MKEKYPKSWELLKKHVGDTYISEMIKAAGGDASSIPEDILEKTVQQMFSVNNVLLFPFFDENKIFLTIKHIENGFRWDIYENEGSLEVYKTRQQAENQGFDKAYSILEAKL